MSFWNVLELIVPRDRPSAVECVHLSGVGNLLVRISRHAGLGEDFESGARVPVGPRRDLHRLVGELLAHLCAERHRVSPSCEYLKRFRAYGVTQRLSNAQSAVVSTLTAIPRQPTVHVGE